MRYVDFLLEQFDPKTVMNRMGDKVIRHFYDGQELSDDEKTRELLRISLFIEDIIKKELKDAPNSINRYFTPILQTLMSHTDEIVDVPYYLDDAIRPKLFKIENAVQLKKKKMPGLENFPPNITASKDLLSLDVDSLDEIVMDRKKKEWEKQINKLKQQTKANGELELVEKGSNYTLLRANTYDATKAWGLPKPSNDRLAEYIFGPNSANKRWCVSYSENHYDNYTKGDPFYILITDDNKYGIVGRHFFDNKNQQVDPSDRRVIKDEYSDAFEHMGNNIDYDSEADYYKLIGEVISETEPWEWQYVDMYDEYSTESSIDQLNEFLSETGIPYDGLIGYIIRTTGELSASEAVLLVSAIGHQGFPEYVRLSNVYPGKISGHIAQVWESVYAESGDGLAHSDIVEALASVIRNSEDTDFQTDTFEELMSIAYDQDVEFQEYFNELAPMELIDFCLSDIGRFHQELESYLQSMTYDELYILLEELFDDGMSAKMQSLVELIYSEVDEDIIREMLDDETCHLFQSIETLYRDNLRQLIPIYIELRLSNDEEDELISELKNMDLDDVFDIMKLAKLNPNSSFYQKVSKEVFKEDPEWFGKKYDYSDELEEMKGLLKHLL